MAQQPPCYFLIDGSLGGIGLSLCREALLQMSSTLAFAAVGDRGLPSLGLSAMQAQSTAGEGSSKAGGYTVKVLERASGFRLWDLQRAVAKLQPLEGPGTPALEGKMIPLAIKIMLDHMRTLMPSRDGGRRLQDMHQPQPSHLFVVAGCFEASPNMTKVMQLCAQSGVCLHLVQLHEPAPELTAHAAAQTTDAVAQQLKVQDAQEHHQQQTVTGGNASKTAAAAFEESCKEVAMVDFQVFVADCPEVSDLLAQRWLQQLLAPNATSSPHTVHLELPRSLAGHAMLRLQVAPYHIPLAPIVQHCHFCPCHEQPVLLCQPQNGAVAAGGDWQRQHQLRCSVTGAAVHASSCVTDSSLVQLGSHTLLRLPSFAVGTRVPSSRALNPGEACVLRLQRVVPADEVSNALLEGPPLLLLPAPEQQGLVETGPPRVAEFTTEAGLLKLVCAALQGQSANSGQQVQQGQAGEGQIGSGQGQESQQGQQEQQEQGKHQQEGKRQGQQQMVLLASGQVDVAGRQHSPLLRHYVLQPAADGCSLLLQGVMAREQLLPLPLDISPKQPAAAGPGPAPLDPALLASVVSELQALQVPTSGAAVQPFSPLQLSSGLRHVATSLLKDSVGAVAVPAHVSTAGYAAAKPMSAAAGAPPGLHRIEGLRADGGGNGAGIAGAGTAGAGGIAGAMVQPSAVDAAGNAYAGAGDCDRSMTSGGQPVDNAGNGRQQARGSGGAGASGATGKSAQAKPAPKAGAGATAAPKGSAKSRRTAPAKGKGGINLTSAGAGRGKAHTARAARGHEEDSDGA